MKRLDATYNCLLGLSSSKDYGYGDAKPDETGKSSAEHKISDLNPLITTNLIASPDYGYGDQTDYGYGDEPKPETQQVSRAGSFVSMEVQDKVRLTYVFTAAEEAGQASLQCDQVQPPGHGCIKQGRRTEES